MQRHRGFIFLGLAACMALLVSVLLYKRLEQQQIVLPPVVSKVIAASNEMVAVAATDLFWGTKLTPEMMRLVPLPPGNLPQGYFPSVESLTGRVLLINVTANEPILETKLAPIDVTRGGVAAVTQAEKRAMAIKVDNVVGVAGFINPGNRVDVLVTLQKDSPTSKTVLQNVLVLAIGTEIERKGDESKPIQVPVVTVEVTLEEGEKLALAANEGKLQLALRNHLNTTPVLTSGATVPSLLDSYRLKEKPAPQPVKQEKTVPKTKSDLPSPVVPAEPPTQVEVIKGSTVTTLTFHKG
jgi:pilus assembly protein CpaB